MERLWAAGVALAVAAGLHAAGRPAGPPSGMSDARRIADVVARLGPAARERLRPHFEQARVSYPPPSLALLAFKQERRLELWSDASAAPQHLRDYPVLAASGGPGPKLREGDLQVPEGAYRVLWLNPASSYHLSMKLDYPNAFDRRQAAAEGRSRLGGDIFIHGREVSIGCLALGDPAIEELFVLVHDVGVARVRVLIAPVDLRVRSLPADERPAGLPWLDGLYASLGRELKRYPR